MSKPRTLPEWDGTGNPFHWILDAAEQVRKERTHVDRIADVPEFVLFVFGRRVDVPAFRVRHRAGIQHRQVPHQKKAG